MRSVNYMWVMVEGGGNEKQEEMEDFDQRRRCKSLLEVQSG